MEAVTFHNISINYIPVRAHKNSNTFILFRFTRNVEFHPTKNNIAMMEKMQSSDPSDAVLVL